MVIYMYTMNEVEKIKTNITSGEPILIYSNEEDETSILVPAEFLTVDKYRLMRKYATGDVAVMMSKTIADKFGMPFLSDALELYAQQDNNTERAIKQSHSGPTFDLKNVDTGSADLDKVQAITRLAEIVKENSYSKFYEEFIIPGHVRTYLAREGLLNERIGHTEMGVFISQYFGLSGVVCLITLKNVETGVPLNKDQAKSFAHENGFPIVMEHTIIELFKNHDRTPKTSFVQSADDYIDKYKKLLLIRRFEEKLEELFRSEKIRGSYHLSVGQEATGVALGSVLNSNDAVFVTHRGHHVALGMNVDPLKLFKECIGNTEGLNNGKAGPMHFSSKENGLWMANGIVAANGGMAAGAALSFKLDKSGSVAVNVIGEGSMDEGSSHEVLNIAALWNLPLVTICENNLYSQSTRFNDHVPVSNLSSRVSHAYGILSEKISFGTDLVHLTNRLQDIVEWVRENQKPVFVEIMTYRTVGHSMSDKDQAYKDEEIDKEWKEKDPIQLYEKYLRENGHESNDNIHKAKQEVENKMTEILNEIF